MRGFEEHLLTPSFPNEKLPMSHLILPSLPLLHLLLSGRDMRGDVYAMDMDGEAYSAFEEQLACCANAFQNLRHRFGSSFAPPLECPLGFAGLWSLAALNANYYVALTVSAVFRALIAAWVLCFCLLISATGSERGGRDLAAGTVGLRWFLCLHVRELP